MRIRIAIAAMTFTALMTVQSGSLFAQDLQGDHGRPEPRMGGIHWARGEKPEAPGGPAAAHGGKPSPNMIYYGGPIMRTTVVQAIFWGASWTSPGDKISGLATFYQGLGSSTFANTSNEYYDSTGLVTSDISYTGSIVDISAATVTGNTTQPILAEVCRVISNPVTNGYYPVYVDGVRGTAGFCAWHSYGTCGGVPIQFAFFFNLDGDAGCDPQDPSSAHSQGLEALANVSAHEISEARTDPRLNAWKDKSGEENADKCAWSFGAPTVSLNGTPWKLQGNWSNAAYTAGTGYANLSGQKGCIDGH